MILRRIDAVSISYLHSDLVRLSAQWNLKITRARNQLSFINRPDNRHDKAAFLANCTISDFILSNQYFIEAGVIANQL